MNKIVEPFISDPLIIGSTILFMNIIHNFFVAHNYKSQVQSETIKHHGFFQHYLSQHDFADKLSSTFVYKTNCFFHGPLLILPYTLRSTECTTATFSPYIARAFISLISPCSTVILEIHTFQVYMAISYSILPIGVKSRTVVVMGDRWTYSLPLRLAEHGC